jgi:GGDEF domain-containing protein
MVGIPAPAATPGNRAKPSAVREQYARMFDGVTGLPSWPLLIDRTHIALQRAARHDLVVAVVVLDDVRRGSSTSPDFSTFVSLLRDAVHTDDTVARIGGCTFVAVLNDVSNRDTVATTTGEIVAGFGVTCRVGIAFGAAPCDAAGLIDEAIRDAAPPPTPPAPQSTFDAYGARLAELTVP